VRGAPMDDIIRAAAWAKGGGQRGKGTGTW